MERNALPVRAPLFGWIRAALPLLILADLLLPRALTAQSTLLWRVPQATAERILTAQTQACRIAETAKGAELDGLDLALQRMIQQQEDLVRKAAQDSAPALAAEVALRDAEARLPTLEAEIGPLHVRRNEINSAQKAYEEQIAATIRGDNPARKSLDDINAEIKALEEGIARLETALAEFLKKNPNPGWLEGRHEELGAAITQKRGELRVLEDKQLTILRGILRVRLDPEYERLVREEDALDTRIQSLEGRIEPLREARDSARKTLADADLAAIKNLEELHEINGFLHQYLSYARDCVERRRGQLAQNVPPPATGGMLTGTATGRWSGGCEWKAGGYVSGRPSTIGGTVNFQFDGAGGVSGTFVSNSGEFGITSFPVVGTLRPPDADDADQEFWVENATGAGAGWSGTWQGRFRTIDGQFTGTGLNAPVLTIQTSQWGEAECAASWSVP